jgi:hypothetical protein
VRCVPFHGCLCGPAVEAPACPAGLQRRCSPALAELAREAQAAHKARPIATEGPLPSAACAPPGPTFSGDARPSIRRRSSFVRGEIRGARVPAQPLDTAWGRVRQTSAHGRRQHVHQVPFLREAHRQVRPRCEIRRANRREAHSGRRRICHWPRRLVPPRMSMWAMGYEEREPP